jgi:hypothetical protein
MAYETAQEAVAALRGHRTAVPLPALSRSRSGSDTCHETTSKKPASRATPGNHPQNGSEMPEFRLKPPPRPFCSSGTRLASYGANTGRWGAFGKGSRQPQPIYLRVASREARRPEVPRLRDAGRQRRARAYRTADCGTRHRGAPKIRSSTPGSMGIRGEMSAAIRRETVSSSLALAGAAGPESGECPSRVVSAASFAAVRRNSTTRREASSLRRRSSAISFSNIWDCFRPSANSCPSDSRAASSSSRYRPENKRPVIRWTDSSRKK